MLIFVKSRPWFLKNRFLWRENLDIFHNFWATEKIYIPFESPYNSLQKVCPWLIRAKYRFRDMEADLRKILEFHYSREIRDITSSRPTGPDSASFNMIGPTFCHQLVYRTNFRKKNFGGQICPPPNELGLKSAFSKSWDKWQNVKKNVVNKFKHFPSSYINVLWLIFFVNLRIFKICKKHIFTL